MSTEWRGGMRAQDAKQLVPAVLTMVAAAVLFAATAHPARAAADGPFAARLSVPQAKARLIIEDGLLWHCGGDTCTAPGESVRPVMACARLARRVGPLVRFARGEIALAEADLARCNAR